MRFSVNLSEYFEGLRAAGRSPLTYAYVRAARAATRERACTITHKYSQRVKLRRVRIRVYSGMVKLSVRSEQPPHLAGVRRGDIVGFSAASRKRLLEGVMSWRNMDNAAFVHLTYHDWPDDWREWKRHLKLFLNRLRRAFPESGALWKLEFQERGAPHYHLIVTGLKQYSVRWFRVWVRLAWAQIAHTQSEYRGKFATRVDKILDRVHALSYATKYQSKLVETQIDTATGEIMPPPPCGRYWAFWGQIDRSPVIDTHTSKGALADLRKAALAWLRERNSRYAEAFAEQSAARGFSLFYIGCDTSSGRITQWRDFYRKAMDMAESHA